MKYYLHDSNAFSDEKVTQLFMEFGYEGLGLFYTVLEKLAMQEKPIKTDVLKKQLFVGKKLEKCWSFMESLGLISSNNGETFNKQLLKFSEKYQIKKEKNAERIAKWRENQDVTENVTRKESVRNTPKDKISKVKRSKEKESKGINTSGEQSSLFLDIKNCFLEWYLLEKNSAYYFTGKDGKAINELIKQIQFAGAQKNEGKPPGWELAAFKWLLKNLPKWVYQNCSLTNISSKFNEIKDGHTASKQQNGNAGLSAEYLADLERRCRPEESV